jgi:hypothetical protein
MRRSILIESFWVAGVMLVLACSSESQPKEGNGAGGKGVILMISGAGPVSTSRAADPLPLPATETDGWQDITAAQRTAMVGQGCDGWSAEPEGAPSVLEFVVDVSGTMTSSTASTNGLSKWEVSRNALRTAIAALPANIAVGLTFYPNMDNGGAVTQARSVDPCIDPSDNVAIAALGEAGSAHRRDLDAALTRVTPEPDGATPTHDALDIAWAATRQFAAANDKYVVLITDGQPTLLQGCYGRAAPRTPEDTGPIITAIGNTLAQDGIRTFIVGSPGSEANNGTGADVRDWLSAAARAGDTASAPNCSDGGPVFCHFDLTQAPDFGAALAGALQTIGQWVVGCDYVLPAVAPTGEQIDPNKVNLIYTDASGQAHLLLPNGAPNCTVGWHYADTAATQIQVCGVTCDSLMNDPRATLDLVFGCTSGQLPSVE